MAVLALLCIAQFVVVLDVTIVAVALPSIQRDLAFSDAGLQWVVTAYTLCFAALLTVAGRAGDVHGRRRMFLAGLAIFAVASLGCGLAPTAELLVVVRAAQGVGAAALSAAALALLTEAFPDEPERGRAVAAWTAAAAGGGASGWLLGGVITEQLGWEWIFFVNVPLGALAVGATPISLRESRDPNASRQLDLVGAALLALGLAALVFGLTTVESGGATSPAALGGCAAAGALLVLFGLRQRSAPAPLMTWSDLRRPDFASAGLVAVLVTATTTPAIFLAVLLEQRVLGYTPMEAGLATAPCNLAVIAGSAAGPVVRARIGSMRAMAAGLVTVGVGAVLLAGAGDDTGYPRLLAAFVLIGGGLGVASVASTAHGTAALAEGREGLAAGLLGTGAQIGTVLGLAVFVPLAAARADAVGELAPGYAWGQVGVAITAVAAGVLLLAVARRRSSRHPA